MVNRQLAIGNRETAIVKRESSMVNGEWDSVFRSFLFSSYFLLYKPCAFLPCCPFLFLLQTSDFVLHTSDFFFTPTVFIIEPIPSILISILSSVCKVKSGGG